MAASAKLQIRALQQHSIESRPWARPSIRSRTPEEQTLRAAESSSVVLLATAPLLRDGVVLVQDVGAHVDQVLLLHRTHLRPHIRALDRWVHLVDLLEAVVCCRVLEVVDEAVDAGPVGDRARELLKRKAHVLIGTRGATDVAVCAGGAEEAPAANQLLLAQGRGLSLAIDGDRYILDFRLGSLGAGDQERHTEAQACNEGCGTAPSGRGRGRWLGLGQCQGGTDPRVGAGNIRARRCTKASAAGPNESRLEAEEG